MNKKPTIEPEQMPIALPALKRAAKHALELALQTKTPLWIMVGGKIVDATKSVRKTKTRSVVQKPPAEK